MESSKYPTVLLKAADVNLMNSKIFVSLFNRKGLEFTSLRMEAYGTICSQETVVTL